jgi:hypothetical protein
MEQPKNKSERFRGYLVSISLGIVTIRVTTNAALMFLICVAGLLRVLLEQDALSTFSGKMSVGGLGALAVLNIARFIAGKLRTPLGSTARKGRTLGYLEVAGRDVYFKRLAVGVVGLIGAQYWIAEGAAMIGVPLLIVGLSSLADAAAAWLRVRMHLYCGNAAEAAEVARFWAVEGRKPPPGGGKPFEQDELELSLEDASEGVFG